MLRTLLLSAPTGMQNYQECDYFCRQTYELLTPKFQFGNPSRFVLLVPAISNRTSHAKLPVRRKSLNLRSHGAITLIRQMQWVFAFGIALFASEQ